MTFIHLIPLSRTRGVTIVQPLRGVQLIDSLPSWGSPAEAA
jgi:hypothetical protein